MCGQSLPSGSLSEKGALVRAGVVDFAVAEIDGQSGHGCSREAAYAAQAR
ncbi:hypothetical protein [Oricola cellulosilytica]|nr:hypothetical protein [Oricola cellulosilytica]